MAVSGISGIFGEVRATCHTIGKNAHFLARMHHYRPLFVPPTRSRECNSCPLPLKVAHCICFAISANLSCLLHGPHPRPQLFERTHPSCLSSTQDFNLLARGCGWSVRIPAKGSQANELTYCASMSSIHVRINYCSGHHKPAILRFVVSRVLVDNSKPLSTGLQYCRRMALGVDPMEAFVACPRHQE